MFEKVNILAELEDLAIEVDYSGSNTVKVICPFHDDSSPSMIFWLDSSLFECKACGAKGDIADYLAKLVGKPRADLTLLLQKKYGLIGKQSAIAPQIIETAAAAIWDNDTFLHALRLRGLTDDTIRERRIGFYKGRISIPVKDRTNSIFVNIRRYLPSGIEGSTGANKMKNLRGRGGKLQIYPYDQLEYGRILLCGGELKALAAAQELNKHGIGCIAVTGGEGEWDDSFNLLLANKQLYVCFDIDAAGQRATTKICRRLFTVVKAVHTVLLPLNITDFPTGDINDYYQTGGEILPLLEKAPRFDPRLNIRSWTEGDYDNRTLSRATQAEHLGERSAVQCMITGVVDRKFAIPLKCQVDCMQDEKVCGHCPVAVMDKDVFDVAPENPAIIRMIEANDEALDIILGNAIGIPRSCKKRTVRPLDRASAQICVASPPLELTATDQDSMATQKVIILEEEVEANEEYVLNARSQPDPSNQETVLLASDAKKSLSSMSKFEFTLSEECRETFTPRRWTVDDVELFLANYVEDLSVNVTGIRMRPDLHTVIALTYHSALHFHFGKKTHRGWLESLILGDSSQGKSEAVISMQRHYQLGHKVDAKNTTVAGLIGGLRQFGTQWMITWGALPTHDARLVILEELKGMNEEVFAAATDTRSSGTASIDKIQAGRRLARTRIIATSNPRSGRPMNSYAFGVDAVQELIGSPEDVRRFDVCMTLGKDEIQQDVIHLLTEDLCQHRYTSELCHQLIMWMWTLKPDDIHFDEGAPECLMETSKRLCNHFSEQIPIVDAGSMRLKLARLAIALAGMTFSSPDAKRLIVRSCHIQAVERLLMRIYSAPSMKYDAYSQAMKRRLDVVDPEQLIKRLKQVPYPNALVEKLTTSSVVTELELGSFAGLIGEDLTEFVQFLVQSYALEYRGRILVLTPGFRTTLQGWEKVKDAI